ncbi:MAG: DoxX family membrane protein [Candidatus Caenarcaniphilales bacterium]|nr:DoxX family membrane protein [Candidatus Caenarcaniphilales bacterium]
MDLNAKPWIARLIRYFLGSIFVVAGFSKLFPLNSFLKQIIAYKLPVPDSLVYIFAVVLIAFEIWIGLSIFLNSNLHSNLVKAQILLAIMIPATIWASFNRAPTCGCYGNLIQREPWQATVEDCLLLAVSFLLVPSSKEKSKKQTFPVFKRIFISVLSVGALVYGFIQLQQIYAFQAEKLL